MDLSFFILAFASLFVIVDPFGLIPVFLHLTEGYSVNDKKRIIAKASIVSFLLLLLFAFFGQAVLSYFGISLAALKITGGILLFLIAFEMIQGRKSDAEISENVEQQLIRKQEELHEIAVIPLAIPLMTGPGALSAVIILMSQAENLVLKLELITAVVAVILFTYSIFRAASRLEHRLGKIGINVLTKFMGLILLAISIQMIIDGITMVIRGI